MHGIFGELGVGYNSGNLKGTRVGRRTAQRRSGVSRSAGRGQGTRDRQLLRMAERPDGRQTEARPYKSKGGLQAGGGTRSR